MALDSDAVFGALLASAAGSVDAAGQAAWLAIAAKINAQIKKADVLPGTFAVPISGPAGSTPITPGTKGTLI